MCEKNKNKTLSYIYIKWGTQAIYSDQNINTTIATDYM